LRLHSTPDLPGQFSKNGFCIWNITDPNNKALVNSIRWLLIVALFFLSIGLIYRYAPAIKKKWKIISPGTILATFLIVLVLSLFSFWIRNFGNMNRIYGSIGTVLILMSLIFISSLVLLIGFELNVSINTLKMLAQQREKMVNDQHNVKFH
jgi:membrane protein